MLLRARIALAQTIGVGLPVKEAHNLAQIIAPGIQATLYKTEETMKTLRRESTNLENSHASKAQQLSDKIKQLEEFNMELQAQKTKALMQERAHMDLQVKQKDELLQSLSQKIAEGNTAQEQLVKQLEAQKDQVNVLDNHPIYGKLLCDFGFKKLYATSPKALCDKSVMPVWEKQRIFREDRSKAIAAAKRKDNRFGLPGVITIFESKNDKRGILDGQHRVGGLELLLQSEDWPLDNPILVEVYDCPDDPAVADLFLEINQAQPVQELDLPGVVDDDFRLAINETSDALRSQHADMFKHSTRCRVPHVNIDNLRQALFNSEEASEVVWSAVQDGDSASEALERWVGAKNTAFSERTASDWEGTEAAKSNKSFDKHLVKCKKFGFFLGLDKGWI